LTAHAGAARCAYTVTNATTKREHVISAEGRKRRDRFIEQDQHHGGTQEKCRPWEGCEQPGARCDSHEFQRPGSRAWRIPYGRAVKIQVRHPGPPAGFGVVPFHSPAPHTTPCCADGLAVGS